MIPWSQQLVLVWRKLLAKPGFAAISVLTLALGIGANAAIFTIVHSVLLEPLPYARPGELYGLWHTAHGIGIPQVEQSDTTYTVYRELSESFAEVGLVDDFSLNLTEAGEPTQVSAASATASLFEVLGVPPSLGRTFSVDEDQPGAPQVVLLGHELWQGRFGGDPAILGRSLVLNGTSWEVIGVMPAGFAYPNEDTQVWIPHVIEPADLGRVNFSYDAVGRLKPGVTVEAAEDELARLLAQLPEVHPGELTAGLLESAQMTPYLSPLLQDVVGDVSRTLWILAGTVGFVLLIACANVANLFLVRAEGRKRELALRSALGSSRWDAVQYFLTESLTLSSLGGLVGIVIAHVALRGLIAMSSGRIPRLGEVGIDGNVWLFTALLSVLSGLAFGLLPVLRFRRPNLVSALGEGNLRASSGREARYTRNALVVAQVALALVLLISSGLMARSFAKLRGVDPGFDAEGLLTVRLSLPRSGYPESEDAAGFYQRLRNELRALPGVDRVGAISNLPMTDGQSNNGAVLEEFPVQPDELPPIVRTNYASPEYFEALSIPMMEGRGFDEADHEQRTGAVIVSQGFARQFWPEESALGKRLVPGLPGENPRWYTIVGVAGDVRDDGLAKEAPPMLYYPVIGYGGENDDWAVRNMSLALRTRVDPETLVDAVRARVWAIDPSLPLIRVQTGRDIVEAATAGTSYAMILLALSAGVALLLGAIGIYGVISYITSQRTREIGIRMALGASRSEVNRMIVGQGLRLAIVGIAVGLVGSLGATRFLDALLFGVASTDTATFVALPLMLLGVSAFASFLPARRAASASPVEALHYE